MKIAVLTYHNAQNYGAALQAYALQKYLIGKGYDCELLNYSCEGLDKTYSYVRPESLRALKSSIKINLNVFLHRKKKKRFKEFQAELRLSEPYNKSNINTADEKYDMFIVGSDQVWNYTNTDSDDTYFLAFVKDCKKKNSYAASFGLSKLPDDKKELYQSLNSFNNISVRESAGAALVKDITGRTVPVVCDPVFLRTKEQWSELTTKIQEKYVLIYQLYYTSSLIDFAEKLAKRHNLKCKFVSISLKTELYSRSHGCSYSNVGPEGFVSLIANAEYVVTNSFHGSAFSLIFNKKLFIELVEDKYNVNSRFKELIDLYNLSGIIINEGTDIKSVPDYSLINTKMGETVSRSAAYIEAMLKGE